MREVAEIGDELRVHLKARREVGPRRAEPPDEVLHAGVDVGAVERGDARLDERGHVSDRVFGVHRPMATSEVPPTLDDARDVVPGRNGDAVDHWASSSGSSVGTAPSESGTAVTSA